jgi:purine-binding chemotaxis protein CheW
MKEANSTYLFFKLYDEIFGVDVKYVIETIEMQELTPIPKTPEFMKGVFVFRGQVVPVIDLRLKFKLDPAPETMKRYIIVSSFEINNEEQKMGFIVDKLIDVVSLSEYDINDFPEIGSKYNVEFVKGVVKYNEELTIILNIEKILTSVETDLIKKVTKEVDLPKEENTHE